LSALRLIGVALMKEQWKRYAVLNLGLVIPESLLHAKVASKKKPRDVIFNDRVAFYLQDAETRNAGSFALFEMLCDSADAMAEEWLQESSSLR
jgi:hypothetical protein